MRRVVSVWFPHWPTDRLRRHRARPQAEAAPLSAEPLVTAMHDGRRRVVAAADQAAVALGLRPGQAMAQALALVPGLQVMDAEPEADTDALRRLARWCHRFTPLVACAGDGLWLDVAGCAHLFGTEHALLDGLVARLQRDGLHARAAVADTPGAAHALARHGAANPMVVPPGEQAAAIAPLPIAALRLSPELDATLRRLGFEQVGHLARVPRPLLARRFGPLPGLRLDQAHGHVQEPLAPLAPEPVLQRRATFLEPLLTAQSLSIATAHLMGPLCEEMERQGLGARQLDLMFERVDNLVVAVRVGTARPSRDAAHLARMLDERLDTVDPGMGVEAMRLVVALAEPLRWEQQAEGGGADVARLVDRLANRLGAERVYRAIPVQSDMPERSVRKGPAIAMDAPAAPLVDQARGEPAPPAALLVDQAYGELALPAAPPFGQAYNEPALPAAPPLDQPYGEPALPAAPPLDQPYGEPAHPAALGRSSTALALAVPPRQWARSTVPGRAPALYVVSPASHPALHPGTHPWRPRHVPALRRMPATATWPDRLQAPTRLLSPPRPVTALAALPDQPPVAFTWRRQRHRVRRADGPERIYGEWWRADNETNAVRDYFLVENDGGQRFWLFREGNGIDARTGTLEWFLHGIF